jgi:hypothetical protein
MERGVAASVEVSALGGVMCPKPTEPALDTLFRSVDHACWEELGRRHGRCGLAAGPWPWTV